MKETLENHVALVTGASSGIGRAVALRLSEAGAAIICADIRSTALQEGYESDIDTDTASLIQQNGGKASYAKTDISDPESVRNAISRAAEEYGRLDILVNCAGISTIRDIVDFPLDDYGALIDINVKGSWMCCKYAIEQMLSQAPIVENVRGRIVNFASISALKGGPGTAAYSQAKASIVGLTKGLAVEHGTNGITVNAIAPGFVKTAMFRPSDEALPAEQLAAVAPVGRIGEPEDIARVVLFLVADEAGFITGQTMSVDGGWSAQ